MKKIKIGDVTVAMVLDKRYTVNSKNQMAIRVYHDGRYAYFSTGVYLFAADYTVQAVVHTYNRVCDIVARLVETMSFSMYTLKELMSENVITTPGQLLFPFIYDGAVGDFDRKRIAKRTTVRVNRILHRIYGACLTFARHSYKTNLTWQGAPFDLVELNMGHANKGVSANYLGSFPAELLYHWNLKLIDYKQDSKPI